MGDGAGIDRSGPFQRGTPEQEYRLPRAPCGATHNAKGTIMGRTPGGSVVNRRLQSWDAHDLFVLDASVFPQTPGYNPNGTVGALACWTAHAITSRYLKSPGTLVHA